MLFLAALLAVGQPAPHDDRAAIVAAENNWEAAEVTGNSAFLDGFLTDDYQSISTNGHAYLKRDIIAGAIRRAKEHPGEAPHLLDSTSIISLSGDTAIVQHHGYGAVSIDLLQKRGGVWRAWYSQHTTVAT